jgi:acylpyruvate hydrolase
VGRNYVDHAKELGNAVPTSPVLFLKPPSSMIVPGSQIMIPTLSRDVHHELELGVVIASTARHVSVEQALLHVEGYVLALDLTARDLQEQAKKKGLPWTISKGFDTFCPIHSWDPVKIDSVEDLELECLVNGQLRQRGKISDMLFSIPTLISYISSIMTLERGDLVLTGTPAGVGPLKPGDFIQGKLSDKISMTFHVQPSHSSL